MRVAWLLPLVAIASNATRTGPPDRAWAYAVSSLVKVRPGLSVARLDEVRLVAGRGECRSFQLVAEGGAPIQGLDVAAPPLHGPRGATISLQVFREGWIGIARPSGPAGQVGPWTDPLIPVVDAIVHEPRHAFPFDAPAGLPTVAYMEACIPRSAPAGVYRGEVRYSARGRGDAAVLVRLRVLRFALPATSSLPTSFGFSGLTAARGHGLDATDPAQVFALTQRYATMALAHRLSLHGMTMAGLPFHVEEGRAAIDFRAYDRELGPFMDGTALPSGARFTSTDLRPPPASTSDADQVLYWRAYAAHLRQRGWLTRAFLYAPDEPAPEQFPAIRREVALLHRADPDLRALVTASRQAGLLGAADIWAPNLNCLFARPGAPYCRALAGVGDYHLDRLRGAELWWYQSCGSHGCGPVPEGAAARYFIGWPSYMVDVPVPLNRAMGMAAFEYGIQGELYYNTVEAYGGAPWSDLHRFGGNGDGTLFYPGIPARIGGKTDVPIASLRLEAIRDGLQDYEYLALARKLGLGALAQSSARSLVRSPWDIELDPLAWERVHRALAVAIDAAWGREYGGAAAVQAGDGPEEW